MAPKLDAGGRFPDMTLTTVEGDTLSLPGDIATDYFVLLFFRGHW